MSRLIDADDFKANIGIETMLRKTICDIIDEQPTAYDPEAVVAELEKRADDNLICADRLRGIEPKTKLCEWKGRAGGFKTAIEIVRKGGVEHE